MCSTIDNESNVNIPLNDENTIMKTLRTFKISVLLILTTLSINVMAGGHGHHNKKKDIVDTAVKAGSFTVLVAAVKAAGLVDTLKGDGPFTVFAPTDAAFAKLPEGTIETLLKPENKQMLADILTYHVVSGKVNAKDVVKLDSAKTVQGNNVHIMVKNGGVVLNDNSNVVKTDIATSNGVIHVIDTVIMPPSAP